jgi:aspartate/methionine/tyrosine aminotransferase
MRRDGIPAMKEHIILTDGASKGVQAVILALLKQSHDGFMIPIPQYPLYSATLTLFGGRQVGYYLDEENKWQLREDLLAEAFASSQRNGVHPVCIVVINPGNPTGGVLDAENIRMIIRFAKRHGLSILADEVYQENIYDPSAKFFSFARVMHEMGEKEISLFSVHSVSKGFLGECGHRGGYLECRNLPEDVMAQFVKLQSISLCSNLPGQFSTYAMVAPPVPGDESYPQYQLEKEDILGSLRRKAGLLGNGLNGIEGLSVDIPQGAMYAFVRLELPREPADDGLAVNPGNEQDGSMSGSLPIV